MSMKFVEQYVLVVRTEDSLIHEVVGPSPARGIPKV